MTPEQAAEILRKDLRRWIKSRHSFLDETDIHAKIRAFIVAIRNLEWFKNYYCPIDCWEHWTK